MKIFQISYTGNLIELVENLNKGITIQVVSSFNLVAIINSLIAIVSKNPIMSVIFLIGLFTSVSLYLASLGLTFIALAYLLVYIGAVSILFLFILMLISVRISELWHDTRNSIILAIYILILLYPTLYYIYLNLVESSKTFLVSGDKWDSNLAKTNHITSIGNIMYTSHSILLIIVSIILVLAMVGSIVITNKPSEAKQRTWSFVFSSSLWANSSNLHKKILLSLKMKLLWQSLGWIKKKGY